MKSYLPKFIMAGFFCCFLLSLAQQGRAENGTVTYTNNRLSINAVNTSLPELLVKVGNKTGVKIYLSTNMKTGLVSLQTHQLSLEDTFKRLLKEYSYAAVFTGSEDNWQISTVKIFPKGKRSGSLVPIAGITAQTTTFGKQTKTVFVTDGKEMPFSSGLPHKGLVGPSRELSTLPANTTADNSPWIILQQQFLQDEVDAFQEQLLLKSKIKGEANDEKRRLLSIAYADEIKSYQAMRRSHLSQLESIKRIYNARTIEKKTATSSGQIN